MKAWKRLTALWPRLVFRLQRRGVKAKMIPSVMTPVTMAMGEGLAADDQSHKTKKVHSGWIVASAAERGKLFVNTPLITKNSKPTQAKAPNNVALARGR
jgi:hypothetical protein